MYTDKLSVFSCKNYFIALKSIIIVKYFIKLCNIKHYIVIFFMNSFKTYSLFNLNYLYNNNKKKW